MASTRPAAIALMAITTLACMLAGCRPGQRNQADMAAMDADGSVASEAGYLPPPQILKAEDQRGGAVQLSGSAAPQAMIHLQAPEGDSLTAKARHDGRWSLRTPVIAHPRMFALSYALDGRTVHAEGALILTPRPGPPALVARAGAGALTIERPQGALAITAVDYDPNGYAAISGVAAPGATVRLFLDGTPAGAAMADAQGRFEVLAANRRLAFGPHDAVVQSEASQARRDFRLVQPGPLATPYRVEPTPGGWQVEWAAPGGGVQTTLVFAGAGPTAGVRRGGSG